MRISELLGKPVVDQADQRLGVVHDVVAVRDDGTRLRLEALVVGHRGVLERLGLGPGHVHGPPLVHRAVHRIARTGEIPWASVVRVTEANIVVRRQDSLN
ncbi:MAG TPA: PRC-barrel domain-containing protein [Acidimicrobiales bacterium]|jgi:sporulation protein YlmC with PRC-barrel domain